EHDAGQTADEEHRQKAKRKQHRRGEADPASIHRRHPVEELDAGWDRHEQGGDHEEQVGGPAHADNEHVMRPNAHGDEGDGHGGGGHELVAEQHLARENRNDLRHHAEHRQDEDVDFGMAKEPEEMLPEEGRAAVVDVEEMGAEVAIEQHHD